MEISLDKRQKNILGQLIRLYVANAQPVASAELAKAFDLSSATIRNEMAELEKQGYILQPHTSAGRVPSEDGFRFYVSEFLKEKEPSEKSRELLSSVWNDQDFNVSVKILAKKLAEISHESVVVAFDQRDVYYTGLSNLFAKPEFSDINLVLNFSRLVDHLDEVIYRIFDKTDENVRILIGRENPFGQEFGTLVVNYEVNGQRGLISLLGPMRMFYEDNLGLLNFSKSLIEGRE